MNADSTQVLGINECWDRLRSTTIGCLAVIVGDGADLRPEIFPVNYAVDHASVVFRSGEGTKVEAIHDHPQVAFEVDGFDPETGTAWSVVVKGTAKPINRTDELLDTISLDVTPWQAGRKNRFVRIHTEEVTGRRFPVADSASWDTPLSGKIRAPRE